MDINRHSKRILTLHLLALVVYALLTGCAARPSNPQDPLEPLNRKVFAFNLLVDKGVYRPVAVVYHTITPRFIDVGITNFFGNVAEVTTIANDVLQLNLPYTLSDAWRLIINSTIGVFGLFDVATKIGLPKHQQDFGLTLAHWGIKCSPYFVIPFYGPSTLRDLVGIPVDFAALSVWPWVEPTSARIGLRALEIVDNRAALLKSDKLLYKAFDPYVFAREAYLQKRAGLITNGTHLKEKDHDHLVEEALDLQ